MGKIWEETAATPKSQVPQLDHNDPNEAVQDWGRGPRKLHEGKGPGGASSVPRWPRGPTASWVTSKIVSRALQHLVLRK